MIEELDESPDIRIANHGDARAAAAHRDDAVGYQARAGRPRSREEALEPLHLEADVADADVRDPGRNDGLLPVPELDEFEVDPRAGRGARERRRGAGQARLEGGREGLVEEAQDVAVSADGGVIEVTVHPG